MKITPNLKVEIPEATDTANTPHYLDGGFTAFDSAIAERPRVTLIPQGSDVPIAQRTANTFYLKVSDEQSSSLPGTVAVSPNMGIKIEAPVAKSKSGISFD